MKKTYGILGCIAVLVLIVYGLLPKQFFEEVIFPTTKEANLIAYDDKSDGGKSTINFESLDSAVTFQCLLDADSSHSAWCGLLWNFDPDSIKQYRNWIFVDSLIFELEAQGTQEVLVKIWAYDPDITDIKKAKTFRLLMKELPLQEGFNRVSIPMEQFYTPDFWYKDVNVSKELTRRHQESIARLEIAPGWNQAKETSFTLKIKSIKAIGISNFSYGIVLLIFIVLMIIAVGRRHQKKGEENETEK